VYGTFCVCNAVNAVQWSNCKNHRKGNAKDEAPQSPSLRIKAPRGLGYREGAEIFFEFRSPNGAFWCILGTSCIFQLQTPESDSLD